MKKVVLVFLAIIFLISGGFLTNNLMQGYIPLKSSQISAPKPMYLISIFSGSTTTGSVTTSAEVGARLIPSEIALPDKEYQLDLYSKYELIGTTKISWNQNELNSKMEKEVIFNTTVAVDSSSIDLLVIKIRK